MCILLPCVEFQPWSLVLRIPLLRISVARSIGATLVSALVSFFLRFFLCVVVIASSSLLVSFFILLLRVLLAGNGDSVRSTEFLVFEFGLLVCICASYVSK